jgi:4-amino-4-deoxy-L-arabinose transferase-like glycosyltransferase
MSKLQRRLLYLILLAYVLLATLYGVVTPLFEASDELWHYPMVKYLADHGLQLPPQDPANPGAWRQEGSQPPLYYILSAILTAGIDTSDMEMVRRINPHADIGVVRPDGNANMIVHRTEMEAFPWRGTALAVHIIRFLSIALGLAIILVTFQLAREIFPDQPLIALGAAALNAFLPMFLFISASVNNDNLSNLLGNLLILLIVRLLKVTGLPHWRDYALLGVVTGAGLLAKLNIGLMIPLVALALLIVTIRLRNWRPLVIGGAISGALTVVIAGWWYWRNWQLYGDPTGLNMFLSIVGRRAIPANLAQLWSERHSFTQAYWGFFGGMNVPMDEAIYLIFNLIGGVALIGAIIYITYALVSKRHPLTWWLPAAVTIIWPVITFVSFLRWTTETPASQGRLIFGALSSIAMWMAVGLTWWLPSRIRPLVMASAVGFFGLAAISVPLVVIAPAYTPPDARVDIVPRGGREKFGEPDGGGEIGIFIPASYNWPIFTCSPFAYPEQYYCPPVGWQILSPLSRDWSMFVHLVTPDGVIVGQRDIYPGQGKIATSDLPAGSTWVNPIAVWIPAAAYAPMTLDIRVGWYDLQSGERMTLPDGSESLTIGQVQLEPRNSELDVPNPISVNFDNQIELVGYSLSDLSPQAGDNVELTLYWRGMRDIERDYVIFAHMIDPATQTIYGSSDAMPVDWQAPTSTWETGTIIEDTHTLIVNPDTPPGIYELEIGLYLQEPDGSFPRLRVVTPDGGMADNYFYLSRVRVLPAEES